MVRRAALVLAARRARRRRRRARTRSSSRKQSVDAKIAALGARVDETQRSEASLRAEVESATRPRSARSRSGSATSRPSSSRSSASSISGASGFVGLTTLFRLQTKRLQLLRRQHAIALRRLGDRLVQLYEPDDRTRSRCCLTSTSFTDALDVFDYLRAHRRAGPAHRRSRSARRRSACARSARRRERRASGIARRRASSPCGSAEVRALRDRLAASRSGLVAGDEGRARGRPRVADRGGARPGAEMDALQAGELDSSRRRSRRRRRRQAHGQRRPVRRGPHLARARPGDEPVRHGAGGACTRASTSPPHRARRSAPRPSGTVIYAGWMGGYGNLVVIDHGGGCRTAYGHQSSIAVGNGAVRRAGPGDRLRRLDGPLDRTAPPLRGARQRRPVRTRSAISS